jgi:threonine dehydrogenase-like Zn-dependent dehydrogenase
MKALAWIPSAKCVREVDRPQPEFRAADEVVVRVRLGGLCGTDREIVSSSLGRLPRDSEYLVMGHEALGDVVEVGKDVQGLQEGDPVAIMPRRPCAAYCFQCRRGHADLCETGQCLEAGIFRRHGFFAEYVVEPARYVFLLSHTLGAVGVLLEPASVCVKTLKRISTARRALFGTPRNRKILVLGAGPIGILTALFATLDGSDVWVESLEAPESWPAQVIQEADILYAKAGTLEAVGFDTLIDCTGHPTAMIEHLPYLSHNSIIALVGAAPCGKKQKVDMGRLLTDAALKNQVFLGIVNAGFDAWQDAFRALESINARSPGILRALITRRLKWPEAPEAFLKRQPGEIKSVIEFPAGS